MNVVLDVFAAIFLIIIGIKFWFVAVPIAILIHFFTFAKKSKKFNDSDADFPKENFFVRYYQMVVSAVLIVGLIANLGGCQKLSEIMSETIESNETLLITTEPETIPTTTAPLTTTVTPTTTSPPTTEKLAEPVPVQTTETIFKASNNNNSNADNFTIYNDASVPKGSVYVGNGSTKKFHETTCAEILKIKPENKVALQSREDAIDQGYVACKKCYP